MHTFRAAFGAVALSLVAAAPVAATQATPYVRVEGRTATLFEGPLRADGHPIRAASDRMAHRCDGTNGGRSTVSGPTPTSLAVDGLSLATAVDGVAVAGAAFDGTWTPGFDDYFVTRYGPDAQKAGQGEYWGVSVNAALSTVGGCQTRPATGDEALWAYDAFSQRPYLRLDPPGTAKTPGAAGFAPVASMVATAGMPLNVAVRQFSGGSDEDPGAPQDTAPAPGVAVVPVDTAVPTGYQTPLTADPRAVSTTAQGIAAITFTTPGWHRLKATGSGPRALSYIRSNRLDVCVSGSGAADCGPLPADAQVRVPLTTPVPDEPPQEPSPTTPPAALPPATTTPALPFPPAPSASASTPIGSASATSGPLRLRTPELSRDRIARGVVGVSFAVESAGPGLRSWGVESQALGITAPWTTRTSGTSARSALLRLPIGREHRLRYFAIDAAGRRSVTPLGKVVVPRDDHRVARGRSWVARKAPAAWNGTLSRGRKAAALSVSLGAGRPLVVLGPRSSGTVELRAGRRRERFTVRPTGATELVIRGTRRAAGTVRVRVRSGTVDLDGVAAGA